MTTQDAAHMTTEQLIDLVSALTQLIREENLQLRQGAPGSLAATLALKIKLGNELSKLRHARPAGPFGIGGDAEQKRLLAEHSAALRDVMNENSANLRSAMVSTRRRVDAIMRALREQEMRPGRYDNSGRRTASLQPVPRSGRVV
ncbi:hypothetical protein SAMN05428969_3353 [Devosia sp. YR412]|uniref:hypothetical protein n=1 Tax=Devosia sp. YR412 TaxID=1881030 RepID=UPI0008C1E326|nr:hypothetical protein [Devosia sp. YR412]SEQ52279.1 hypothetical protein SAMN05428969_3353 [Devosia sp. YR412]